MTFGAGLRVTCSLIAAALFAAGFAPSLPARSASASGAVLAVRNGSPRLVVDGQPFFFFGGAFFYERIAPERWRDSMESMRAIGANTLDLYIPWNWHELADGTFDFDGHTDPRRNLREVLRLGDELGFHFIVRPGPVIRNEWRNGGYPDWLLARPEYNMPLHDRLEGRYPATATLQNARSDDAAAEWMQNATHMRYAARWLHRALSEFRPYRRRVLAVALDDDQAAYIDNQTYPAPNLHRYLLWLNAQVRDAIGTTTPTFINTYQMRVPSSSPVWTMGNWYQSDAYTVGDHDRVDLDFSTLLLATNRRGPPAQSEFQAGWLASAADPQPRPADPRNTTVALDELLALGVQGVVDFPLQDTFAEPGWEAPFSNAFYGWDAALGFAPDRLEREPEVSPERLPPRLEPTHEFGALVRLLGPVLAVARRRADLAIAYGEPPARKNSMPPAGSGAVVAAVRAALAACIARGLTCDIVTSTATSDALRRYRWVVIPSRLAAASPHDAALIRLSAKLAGVPVTADVPRWHGSGVTTLRGPLGTIRIATNWADRPRVVSFAGSRTRISPHTAVVRIEDVSLAALGAHNDHRRISSDCDLADVGRTYPRPLGLSNSGRSECRVTLLNGRERHMVSLMIPTIYVTLPDVLLKNSDLYDTVVLVVAAGLPESATNLTPSAWLPLPTMQQLGTNQAVVETGAMVPDFGTPVYVLRNDRIRLIIDPAAGARAFSLQARLLLPSSRGRQLHLDDGEGWSKNAFDATGAWRDDVGLPLPASARDYIARATHGYPAGTFNRVYGAHVLSSGSRASVEFSYVMPDVQPAGTTFDRIVTLEAGSSRVVVDERILTPLGAHIPQRLVVRSSLPLLRSPVTPMGTPLGGSVGEHICANACILPAGTQSVGAFRDGFAFVTTWAAQSVESAAWTPYRSTGTLALTMAPGVWHRVVYAYAAVPSLAEARAFAEAERTWVSANPVTAR